MAPRSAFTIVESLISVVLVGGVVVAALNTVGASATGRKASGDRITAILMAQDLMAEILTKPYEDPDGSPVFGVEPGELTINRAAFDDVDDYSGWSSTPKYRDGTDWPDRTTWLRVVKVGFVAVSDMATEIFTDSGVKRITVVVENDGKTLATLTAIRARATDVASANLLP